MVRKKTVLAALIVFALAAVLFSGVALAQSSTPAKGWFCQAFIEKLAANLGVDKGKLEEAVKQTGLQLVDEAVQQGRLTSEQAEKIKARIQEGQWFPGHFWGREAGGPGGFHLTAVAEALGMTPDELSAQLKQGKTIPEIAQEKGISIEQLRQKVFESKIQAIQQAVKDGKLTQEKADQLIQRMQSPGPHKGWRGGNPPAAGQAM